MSTDRYTDDVTDVIRREKELTVATSAREAGRLGVRKVVDHERASTVVPVGTEHADVERHPVTEGDSGEAEVRRTGPSPSRCPRRNW